MLPKNCFLAAIDLGSNSFRLEVDHYFKGQVFRKDYLRTPVRLGKGLNEKGELSQESMERGWACLREFKNYLRNIKIYRIRAVGTQTLRIATNQEQFIQKGQKILGFPIEVITGQEEAHLIYTGVTAMLDRKEKEPKQEKRLIVDVGGRSTELVLGFASKPLVAESCPVGSVGLNLEFFNDGLLTKKQFKLAIAKARELIEPAIAQMQKNNGEPLVWDQAYGSSGTVGAVSSVLKSNNITDGRITRTATQWMYEQLITAGSVQTLNMPKLGDRQDVVGGGLAIIMALFECFEQLEELQSARGALRQGIIFDMIAKELVRKK